MSIINKSVEFQLLPTNEVLVSVTVSVGQPEQSDMTTVVRQRLDCNEFCAKALPIIYQNYNTWPPPAPASGGPANVLPRPPIGGSD